MKKIFTILLVLSSLFSFAQGPIIEGTYLPVRGTSVKEIWVTPFNTPNSPNPPPIPYPGIDTVWDYSNTFNSPAGQYEIKTFHPDSIVYGNSYGQYFGSSTHASYLRAPFNDLTDSLYSYYIIDTNGLFMVGGRSMKAIPSTGDYVGYDTTSVIDPPELYVPNVAYYGMNLINTSRYQTYGRISGFPVKIKGSKVKNMNGIGYGTLTMPDGRVFTDVLLSKVLITRTDSVFDASGTTFLPATGNPYISSTIEYSFIRNNTFGSSALMYFSVNAANTSVNAAFYTLPVDCGSISGKVFDSLNEANPVIKGEAYLYRENSNFAKNDILAKDSLDSNGEYHFTDIPYGEYRISIRPDTSIYHYALTTYWSDTINGNDALSVYTDTDSTWNTPIHLQYHTDSVGLGQIFGSLDLNLGIEIGGHPNSNFSVRTSEPIPGIDVVVLKNPGGIAMREVKTDFNGAFSLNDLADGTYNLYVDIPGLLMAGTYDFTISGGTLVNCLNFTSGTDSIHPTCAAQTGLAERDKSESLIDVFPNPYASFTTIKLNLSERSDVVLEVYNILGEKIQTIERAQKQQGVYSYNFNAKSLNHSPGIYFIKVTAGSKTSVVKIIEQ